MTNWLRGACVVGLATALSVSAIACSNDDQSLGSNNLATTNGGSGGSGGADPAGSAGAGEGGSAGSAGSPSVEPQTRRICDGSDGITLGHTSRGGGQIEAIETVIFEAGFGSFYVDGHCNFWIINAVPQKSYWAPAKTGTLTNTEEAQLALDLGYAGWGGLEGAYCGPPASDQGATFVFDRSTALACAGPVKQSAPEAVRSAFTNAYDWEQKLFAKGTAVKGPMRLRSARSDNGFKTHPLPLSFSLASVVVAPDNYTYGDAPLVTDQADLAALRDLRALVLADDTSTYFQFEVLGDDNLRYQVALRDALPIENEHGLIPIPGTSGGN